MRDLNMAGPLRDIVWCVEQLVFNSVDAGSTCIAIRINWSLSRVVVVDNGSGIEEKILHCISSRETLPSGGRKIYGSCGQFLRELEESCAGLAVSTRTRGCDTTLEWTKEAGVSFCEKRRPSCGTTVTVDNFLIDWALMDEKDQFSRVIRFAKSLSLILCKVTFSVRDDAVQRCLFQTKIRRDTVAAACKLFDLRPCTKLNHFQKNSKHFMAKGLFWTKEAYEKECHRHIFINNIPIHCEEIVKAFQFSHSALSYVLNIRCNRRELQGLSLWKEDCTRLKHWPELRSLLNSLVTISKSCHGNRGTLDVPPAKYSLLGKMSCHQRFPSPSYGKLKNPGRPDSLQEWSTSSEDTQQDPEKISCQQSPSPSYGKLRNPLVDNSTLTSPHSRCCRHSCSSQNRLDSLRDEWSTGLQNTQPEPECQVDEQTDQYLEPAHNQELEPVHDQDPEYKSDTHEQRNQDPDPTSVPQAVAILAAGSGNWIQVSDDQGSHFYLNKLSGNTSFVEPDKPETNGIFSTRTRIKVQPNPVDLTKVPAFENRFWVSRREPMDVSKGIGLPFQVVKGRCTLTKELLANCVTVISQVDAKFISCVVRHDAKSYLLLVDQHAAHERVCLEKLINLHSSKDQEGYVVVQSSAVHPALELTISADQVEVVTRLDEQDLRRIGIVRLKVTGPTTVSVAGVPSCFLERDAGEVRRSRCSVYGHLAQALLVEAVTKFAETGRVSSCLVPDVVRNVLNSLACHGAIRFGDELSYDQCRLLMRSLGQCDVPFQCAHGRPLIAPLIELGDLKRFDCARTKPRYKRLRTA